MLIDFYFRLMSQFANVQSGRRSGAERKPLKYTSPPTVMCQVACFSLQEQIGPLQTREVGLKNKLWPMGAVCPPRPRSLRKITTTTMEQTTSLKAKSVLKNTCDHSAESPTERNLRTDTQSVTKLTSRRSRGRRRSRLANLETHRRTAPSMATNGEAQRIHYTLSRCLPNSLGFRPRRAPAR